MLVKIENFRIAGQTDERRNGWMDGRTDGRTVDEQTDSSTNEWTDERPAGRTSDRPDGRAAGRPDGWTDERTDERVAGPDGRMDDRTDAVCYRASDKHSVEDCIIEHVHRQCLITFQLGNFNKCPIIYHQEHEAGKSNYRNVTSNYSASVHSYARN